MSGHGTAQPMTARKSGPLTGRAEVPGDKSISHRALIFGAMADRHASPVKVLRWLSLATAAAMALAEFGTVLDEVFEERGQRDNDASVDEWLRSIQARYRTHGKWPKTQPAGRVDVGGKIATPWEK